MAQSLNLRIKDDFVLNQEYSLAFEIRFNFFSRNNKNTESIQKNYVLWMILKVDFSFVTAR